MTPDQRGRARAQTDAMLATLWLDEFLVELGDALAYTASYEVWLSAGWHDRPEWRETWIRHPLEQRVALAEKVLREQARTRPIARGPAEYLAMKARGAGGSPFA